MSISPSQKSDIPPLRTDIDFSFKPRIFLIGVGLILLGALFFWWLQPRPYPVDSAIPHYARAENLNGKLVSVGSDTLDHVMVLCSQGFRKLYPEVVIQIDAKGSVSGPPALIDGKSQLAPMSRVMNEDEVGAFEKKYGYKPTPYKVGLDELAVYVNKDNPIRGMTLQQVDEVFSSTLKRRGPSIETWGSLGLTGKWADKAIVLYGRDKVSGTHDFFKEHALQNGDFKTTLHEEYSEGIVESVGNEPLSIGYSGIGWKSSHVRAVALGENAGNLVEPNYKNAFAGTYPLARFLYIYVNQKPGQPLDNLTGEFIKYVLSREGQEAVSEARFFPLPARIVAETLSGKN